MKKLLLIILLAISTVGYSQEIPLGKTVNEITLSSTHRIYSMMLNSKQAICEIVDTNISDVYIFNIQGICIEYNRLFSNIGFETIQNSFLTDYYATNNVWINDNKGLVAMVSQMSNTLYKVSIRKMY